MPPRAKMLNLLYLFLSLILILGGLELVIRQRAIAGRGAWQTRPLPVLDGQATRIVVLGDSIAYGDDLPEAATWPSLIGERLRQTYPHRRWQVVNAGVSGNTTADATARFQQHVQAYRPHLLLIALGLNDARQVHRGVDAYRLASFYRNEQSWYRWSYVLRAIANRLDPLPAIDYAQDGPADTPRIPPDHYRTLLTWLLNQAGALQMQPAILTLSPVSSELDGNRQHEHSQWASYNQLIREVARSTNTPYIEVSHPFQVPDPWLADGVHLSPEGEAILAESVWRALHRPTLAAALSLDIEESNADMAPSLE